MDEKLRKLSEYLDDLETETEEYFCLWYLMDKYIKLSEKSIEEIENAALKEKWDKTKTFAHMKAKEHIKFAEEAKDVLANEMW